MSAQVEIPVRAESDCTDFACTRRRLLLGGAAVAGVGALELASPQLAFAAGLQSSSDLLVVISLRGGADGLNLVPPLGDHNYLTARPDIAVKPSQAIRLDGHFGLHPAMRPLLPYWTDKRFAIVHAVGDSDGTRSHFEATDALERGVNETTNVETGWIDRLLVARGLKSGDFPAVAVGARPPGELTGTVPSLSMYTVQGLRVNVPANVNGITEQGLAQMYAGLSGAYATAGRETLDALHRFAPLRAATYAPRAGVKYPTDSLSNGLEQIAQIARANVGLKVATVDAAGSWDTHVGMGNAASGYFNNQAKTLATGLATFIKDLGPLFATTTIVTVSEFGRRVAQNGSGGLDHGHGSVMMVLGGGINGGKVYGRWPGLAPAQLDNGDLKPTTDYRDVLGELVHRRLGGAAALKTVFPDHRVAELGLARQR